MRQFKQLASLNLSGNPFCSASSTADHTYPLYPVATLPQLVYLDFKFISSEAVSCGGWGSWCATFTHAPPPCPTLLQRLEAKKRYSETVELLMLKDRETERKMTADEEQLALMSTLKVCTMLVPSSFFLPSSLPPSTLLPCPCVSVCPALLCRQPMWTACEGVPSLTACWQRTRRQSRYYCCQGRMS